MTLNIQDWIQQAVEAQSKISHNEIAFAVRPASKLPSDIKQKLESEYGDTFMNDCQYVLFFKKYAEFSDKEVQKLFELTNSALGKAANNMAQSDFKKLNPSEEDQKACYLFLKITVK